MKNIYFSAFAAFVMFLSSCGGKGTTPEGPTPEEEVRSYGKDFVAKLTAKQLDSLKASYPDIVTADSIATLKSDTILVSETAPEQYDITLAEGVVLKATRSQDGNIEVISSRGLFAFPSDKMEMARKTGRKIVPDKVVKDHAPGEVSVPAPILGALPTGYDQPAFAYFPVHFPALPVPCGLSSFHFHWPLPLLPALHFPPTGL